jgi:hypothetical protein
LIEFPLRQQKSVLFTFRIVIFVAHTHLSYFRSQFRFSQSF